jgi:Zn-dependent protease with chaperone function
MRVIPFLLAFILLVPVLALAETYTYGPVTITGPDKVAIGETFNYTVNVQQIFNHYKIVFVLSGYNLTGASPISPQYLNGTFSPQNFTITAPSVQTTFFSFSLLSLSLLFFFFLSSFSLSFSLSLPLSLYSSLFLTFSSPSHSRYHLISRFVSLLLISISRSPGDSQ